MPDMVVTRNTLVNKKRQVSSLCVQSRGGGDGHSFSNDRNTHESATEISSARAIHVAAGGMILSRRSGKADL